MIKTHKFKIGDRVVWHCKEGDIKGTVKSLSSGLSSISNPMVYIKFDNGWKFWVAESSFLKRIYEQEKVIFT